MNAECWMDTFTFHLHLIHNSFDFDSNPLKYLFFLDSIAIEKFINNTYIKLMFLIACNTTAQYRI